MTTEPARPLPGLPAPAEEPVALTQIEVATLRVQAAVEMFCEALLAERPDLPPADGAGAVGEVVGKTLAALMHPGAARLGLLVAFEQSHEEPMSFIRINGAKEALTQLADKRRRRDRTTASGLIIPGKD